ncbi:hypothetical protein BGZ80_008609, partial [Entomortierella chlamydospora]
MVRLAPSSMELREKFDPELPKKTIHVYVKPPQQVSSDQILKRRLEEDPRYALPSRKIRIIEQWREYKASDDNLVLLPPAWIEILESNTSKPAPRSQFAHLLRTLVAGQEVSIPTLGQTPKDFG